MSDTFNLRGSASIDQSPVELDSGDWSLYAALGVSLGLTKKYATSFNLDADGNQSVPMGGLASAHMMVVTNVTGVPIVVSITTTDGVQQIPCSDVIIIVSTLTPITAISARRSSAVASSFKLMLGTKQ
jgi:hypothetical protein